MPHCQFNLKVELDILASRSSFDIAQEVRFLRKLKKNLRIGLVFKSPSPLLYMWNQMPHHLNFPNNKCLPLGNSKCPNDAQGGDATPSFRSAHWWSIELSSAHTLQTLQSDVGHYSTVAHKHSTYMPNS